jgi:protein-L-isoaspartate O-methyltransferase
MSDQSWDLLSVIMEREEADMELVRRHSSRLQHQRNVNAEAAARPTFFVRTNSSQRAVISIKESDDRPHVHVQVGYSPTLGYSLKNNEGVVVYAPTIRELLLALNYLDATTTTTSSQSSTTTTSPAPAPASSSTSSPSTTPTTSTTTTPTVSHKSPSSNKKKHRRSNRVINRINNDGVVHQRAARIQVGLKGVAKLADSAKDVLDGVGQLAVAVSTASPILSAVVGLVAKVVAMRAQVQINKRKAVVLVDLVDSFSVPLDDVRALLADSTLDVAFARHLQERLESLESAIKAALGLLHEWSQLSSKSLLKRVRQTLAAHAFDRAFDDCSAELERCHARLCHDLTLKAATVALGVHRSEHTVVQSSALVAVAIAKTAEARESDLTSLEQDLSTTMRAMQTTLSDELQLLGWSLDGLHASVAEMRSLQHEMLGMQRDVLMQQRDLACKLDQLLNDAVGDKTASAKVKHEAFSIRHAAAAAFWVEVIAPKQATGDSVPWSQFASAVYCELLKPASVPLVDWHAIKQHVQALFDADLDGHVTIMEYDSVTAARQQSVTEICLALLRELKRSEYCDLLIEDVLLSDGAVDNDNDTTAPTQAVCYPRLSAEQRDMVQALFGVTNTEDESLLFAMSSVPRAWFAVDARGGAAASDACSLERHFVAGALRMPSARLCADLLRWLGFAQHERPSFVHVSCGNAYVNAVVGVAQQWAARNVAVAEHTQGALTHAASRVAAFAVASHVDSSAIEFLPSLAMLSGARFDRVLVSLLCPSVAYVRDRFASLIAADGCLVAPVHDQQRQAVMFVRVAGNTNSEAEQLRCVTASEQVNALQRLFAQAPPHASSQYANLMAEA